MLDQFSCFLHAGLEHRIGLLTGSEGGLIELIDLGLCHIDLPLCSNARLCGRGRQVLDGGLNLFFEISALFAGHGAQGLERLGGRIADHPAFGLGGESHLLELIHSQGDQSAQRFCPLLGRGTKIFGLQFGLGGQGRHLGSTAFGLNCEIFLFGPKCIRDGG